MATTTVQVPDNGSEAEREAWEYNLGAQIDAGNDVKFVKRSAPTEETHLTRLMCIADGKLTHRGRATNIGAAVPSTLQHYYVAGGWHYGLAIAFATAADSETAKGFIVKM